MSSKDFIEKAKKVHGDTYEYPRTVYLNTHKRLTITCKIHGDFWQIAASHLRGHGCPMCSNVTISQKLRSSTEVFIEKARKVHPNQYDYSKVVYIKAKDKVIIICLGHGDFLQTPSMHLRGQGCPKCANRK